mmetsp:Transcript_12346/g.31566  ORF Transcript_12346/g.31566 Transcript_12346/m.31566 type:complete len:209 (-) Transcript_12346:1871-2497(-)
MVVETAGRVKVLRVGPVDVRRAVVPVTRVKRPHPKPAQQRSRGVLERLSRVLRVKELRSHRHGHAKIGTELVVCKGGGRAHRVLVDATAVDNRRNDVVLGVLGRRFRDPKTLFKIRLDCSIPLRVREPISVSIGVVATLVKSREPSHGGLDKPNNFNVGAVPWGGRHPSVLGVVRLAHLVHPSAAVPAGAAVDKASCAVQPYGDIESL